MNTYCFTFLAAKGSETGMYLVSAASSLVFAAGEKLCTKIFTDDTERNKDREEEQDKEKEE